MGYSSSSARQYDHLAIPDVSTARRKPASNIEYLDTHRPAERRSADQRPRMPASSYNFVLDPERGALERRAYYANGQRRWQPPTKNRIPSPRIEPHTIPPVSKPAPALSYTDFKTIGPNGRSGGRVKQPQARPAARRDQQRQTGPTRPKQTQSAPSSKPRARKPVMDASRGRYGAPVRKRPAPSATSAHSSQSHAPRPARKSPDVHAVKQASRDVRKDLSEHTITGLGAGRVQHAARPGEFTITPGMLAHQRSRAKIAFSTVLTIVLVFALLSCVLAGYSRNSDVSHQIATVRASNEELEDRISKIEMQAALEDDLGEIDRRASALGLGAPSDDQVEYVTFPSADTSSDAQSSASNGAGPDGFLETLGAWVHGIFNPG